MSFLIELLLFFVTITIAAFFYVKWTYSYWKRRNVPQMEPKFPFGTLCNPFTRKEHTYFLFRRQFFELKAQGHKHGGLYIFTRPIYMPIDVEYIKNILSNDFQYFSNRDFPHDSNTGLSKNLFTVEVNQWKVLRAKFTPMFTSSKIKSMFPILMACGDQLRTVVEEIQERHEAINIKDVLNSFTVNVIVSCAFGLECNTFENPDSPFKKFAKQLGTALTKMESIRFFIIHAVPMIAKITGLSLYGNKYESFFMDIVKKTVEYRERTNFTRKDFMQILIDMKNSEDENNRLTLKEIAAQAFVFFFAGFETSSSTMAFCLYELAYNLEIQEKVHNEITKTLSKYDGIITYDSLKEMKYLDQVIHETLRKYPAGSVLARKCVKDYKMPETDLVLKKGTLAVICIIALHHDPEYFPEPEKFDPDRFSDENKDNIRSAPYMPFGDGPRNCLGLKFGLLQTKLGLVQLLSNFNFSLNKKTEIPPELNKHGLFLMAKENIWLDAERII